MRFLTFFRSKNFFRQFVQPKISPDPLFRIFFISQKFHCFPSAFCTNKNFFNPSLHISHKKFLLIIFRIFDKISFWSSFLKFRKTSYLIPNSTAFFVPKNMFLMTFFRLVFNFYSPRIVFLISDRLICIPAYKAKL